MKTENNVKKKNQTEKGEIDYFRLSWEKGNKKSIFKMKKKNMNEGEFDIVLSPQTAYHTDPLLTHSIYTKSLNSL